jgi:hypothetical protein
MIETQQQIKDRLLKSASLIWGLKGPQTENSFDPLVSILLGACATELEKISHEIEDTRGRTLERMVQLLYPEVLSNAIPAHAIIQAYPSEKFLTLQNDVQFYYQKRFLPVSEGTPPIWKNIFFTATGNLNLHQSTIKLIATTKNIYKTNNGLSKEVICNNIFNETNIEFQNSIWLGIEGIENLTNNTTFYFELKNEANKNIFYDYLPRAKWYSEHGKITTTKNYGENISIIEKPNPDEIIKGKTNSIIKIVKHINKFYANRFITTTNLAEKKYSNVWPHDLTNIYSDLELKKIKEINLAYIRIDFPENLNISKLAEDLFIGLNCVPVVNKHLISSQHKLTENINIIPLASEEFFLDISEVTDMQENILSSNNNTEGSVKINLHFGGVERFNEKNASSAVEGLIQQLRDESAAFANIGNDFLNMELKSVQQSLNKIEQRIEEKQLLKGDTPYLILSNKQALISDNINVKYWTTNGEDANNIKAGTSLTLYKNADLQSNSLIFVTNTVGGRNKLNNNDKVLAYKTALLSKEKLVTEEDIVSYCQLRLALKEAKIEVKKGYQTQLDTKAGFIKTIDVFIFLTEMEIMKLSDTGGLSFWQDDLIQSITDNSNFFMPLRVFINSK